MSDEKKLENQSFTLTDNSTGQTYELPVLGGTVGPKAIDVRRLYRDTGYFAYDPGFTSTASCSSAITFIDGDEGVLQHRGYDIDALAEHSDYLDVCYLLLYGDLPSAQQKKEFDKSITTHTMVHDQLASFFKGFRRKLSPDGHHGWCSRRIISLLS